MSEVARRRAAAQHISSTKLGRPEDVVAWLGAVQAQDYLGALWAIGLRVTRAGERDVECAIAERRIVRTWPMRGTLHFVPAADARWMIELLAERPVAAAASRLRALALDPAVLTRARRALVRELEGGRKLTRPAAYGVLESAGISPAGQRGIHILWRLAQECVVCFGAREGKQATFVLFDEWLPDARPLDRDAALGTLARRYFTSHGPATLRDFVWWSGLKVADARSAIHLAGRALCEESVDGERHWSAGDRAPRASSKAHVLPAFDELLVGYADRSATLRASLFARVCSGGVIRPIVVRDGRTLGTWSRRIVGREVRCSVAPFERIPRRTVTPALERYAGFLGLELRKPYSLA